MNNYHNLNFDKFQVEKLINFLKPLKDGESYMMLLASRNKYLSEENKINYRDIHGSNVIDRQMIRPGQNIVNKIEQILNRWSSRFGAYISKDNQKYPNEMLIPYIKINPGSMVKAYFEFKKSMIEIEKEFIFSNNKSDIMKKFNRIDRQFMSNIQASYSEKYIIDLDIDINEEDRKMKETVLEDIFDSLKSYCKDFDKTKYLIVDTFSGYHILFEKSTLDCQGFYQDFLNKYVMVWIKELALNKEYMIPVPGCFQGNHQVVII